ncbi:MAG: sigma-70 family RNA polymerase sigma factor [Cytophagaceae bacterium]|jgi:RNA polymerase sigma-70 factor (ECF subfamily)|nr:sigma-70 family RNA polymerase sigma factor [Cytophagaceae bacterium]
MKLFGRNKTVKTDLELLAEFRRSGSLEVLADLFLRYNHLVLGVCFKYLKDPEASKDMTMQIFEKLTYKLPQFEVSNFSSWLHTMVRNECLMELRRRAQRSDSERLEVGDENSEFRTMEFSIAEHPTENDSLEGDLSKLEECIQTLASEQRVCVELFFLREKCYKEITEEVGFDLKKVKSYIQNGKRNLKICMERKLVESK